MTSRLIVSASGIRGIVGQQMRREVAARYGEAFGRFLRESGAVGAGTYVLVGRDTRPSGEELAAAAMSGVQAAGIAARDAGVAPTPTLLLSVADRADVVGGLVVTASHNPAEWNGLKLASGTGRFLSPEEGRRVEELYGEGGRGWGTGAREGEVLADFPEDIGSHHLRRILALPFVNPKAVEAAGILVALDCVNGAAAPIVPSLLEALGCGHTGIGLQANGRFGRNPEPTGANLISLGDLVRESGATIGLGFDPDGDRLALVDETGRPVGEDWTLAIAAEYVLSKRAGPLVTNLSSSRCIEDVAQRAGVAFYRTPVGEASVAAKMAEVVASIGGEGNGGVILPDLNLSRDALLATALVLSFLAEEGQPLSRVIASRPSYSMVRRKLPGPVVPRADVFRVLEDGAPEGAQVDRADGLRLEWRAEREWLHVRPSGTEPVWRIMAESPEPERADDLASWAESVVSEATEHTEHTE